MYKGGLGTTVRRTIVGRSGQDIGPSTQLTGIEKKGEQDMLMHNWVGRVYSCTRLGALPQGVTAEPPISGVDV